jgi:hypothetical protein
MLCRPRRQRMGALCHYESTSRGWATCLISWRRLKVAGVGPDGACHGPCGRRLGWQRVRRMTGIVLEKIVSGSCQFPRLALLGTQTWERETWPL